MKIELLVRFTSSNIDARKLRRALIELIADQAEPGGVLNEHDDEDMDVHVMIHREEK